MSLKMAWVLGWAVPEAWFARLAAAALPGAQHVYFPAEPGALARLAEGSWSWTIGYSLGAHLLLAAAARGSTFGRVALLAPIFALPREENLGGRIGRAQVRHLARWLRRDAAAARADFYQRAGLDVPAECVVAADEDLLWGLERLTHDRVEPPLPPQWRAWCGADDPLLDAARLREAAPGVEIVNGATHHPAGLLSAFAKEAA